MSCKATRLVWCAIAGGMAMSSVGHAGNAVRETVAGYPAIIDGDTIEFVISDETLRARLAASGVKVRGRSVRVRLWGIDAPEMDMTCNREGTQRYRCGIGARSALTELIGGDQVTCVGIERDQFDRLVARCGVGSLDLAAELVRNGWAVDYRRYSRGAYAEAERDAREAKLGIFSGTFIAPWVWRHSAH